MSVKTGTILDSKECQAFLEYIREAPEEDQRKLEFADWLEDNGDVKWAEYIRTLAEVLRLQVSLLALAGEMGNPRAGHQQWGVVDWPYLFRNTKNINWPASGAITGNINNWPSISGAVFIGGAVYSGFGPIPDYVHPSYPIRSGGSQE